MAAEGEYAFKPSGMWAELQWGRGRMAAEGYLNVGGLDYKEFASMGPRPDGRGRFQAKDTTWPMITGFNGAAAGWPRKA